MNVLRVRLALAVLARVTSVVVGKADAAAEVMFPLLMVVVPPYVFAPDRVNTPEPVPSLVKFLFTPEITEPIVTPPVPEIFTILLVALPSTTPILTSVKVSSLVELLLKMVFETPRKTAPFKVKVPLPEEVTTAKELDTLSLVISIAPIESDPVVISMPAIFEDPALLNRAILETVHAANVVIGVQFAELYQAEAPDVFVHGIIMFEDGTSSPVDKITAEKLFVPLLKTICEICWPVSEAADEPIKILPVVPFEVPLYVPVQPVIVNIAPDVQLMALLLANVSVCAVAESKAIVELAVRPKVEELVQVREAVIPVVPRVPPFKTTGEAKVALAEG